VQFRNWRTYTDGDYITGISSPSHHHPFTTLKWTPGVVQTTVTPRLTTQDKNFYQLETGKFVLQ
jgi:hypothetical protein